nr:hypothetical protein [Mycolicibacter icosiumassiliensis]
MLEENLHLLLWTEVLFGSNPYGADTVFVIGAQFSRTRPDAPVSAEHDEPEGTDYREPILIVGAAWDLRQFLVSGVPDIFASAALQEFA